MFVISAKLFTTYKKNQSQWKIKPLKTHIILGTDKNETGMFLMKEWKKILLQFILCSERSRHPGVHFTGEKYNDFDEMGEYYCVSFFTIIQKFRF